MKAAGRCPPLFISPPVSSPCWRCGVEPRRGPELLSRLSQHDGDANTDRIADEIAPEKTAAQNQPSDPGQANRINPMNAGRNSG